MQLEPAETEEMAREPLSTGETKSVEFEVVQPDKPKRNPRGRTARLTPRVFMRICHLVEQGWAITKAVESQSITYSCFRHRCQGNPKWEARIKKAEAVRFQRRHEEAVESVMRAGEKSWMAHAWYLERVLPHLYALKNVNRTEGEAEAPVFDKISQAELLENAQAAIDAIKNRPAGLIADQSERSPAQPE